jgi:hypothetical protein
MRPRQPFLALYIFQASLINQPRNLSKKTCSVHGVNQEQQSLPLPSWNPFLLLNDLVSNTGEQQSFSIPSSFDHCFFFKIATPRPLFYIHTFINPTHGKMLSAIPLLSKVASLPAESLSILYLSPSHSTHVLYICTFNAPKEKRDLALFLLPFSFCRQN